MTGASRMAAMIFSSPPQFGQCSRSNSKTRLSSRAQLMRVGRPWAQFGSHGSGCVASARSCGPDGTTRARSLALGASPMNPDQVQARSWHQRGQPPHELQRRHHQVRGAVVPGCLQLQHDLPGRVALHPFVGQSRAGDVAAQLFQRFAVVGITAHGVSWRMDEMYIKVGDRRQAATGSATAGREDMQRATPRSEQEAR